METTKKLFFYFWEHEGENTGGTSCVLMPTKLGKGSVGGGQTDQKGPSHPNIRVGNPSVGSHWPREVRSLRFNLKQSKRNDKQTHTSPRHTHTFHSVTDTHLSLSLKTHQHMDRVLYTYMTSYLAESYRLSIHYWRTNPLIHPFLIMFFEKN